MYGDALVCVRYRYDEGTCTRVKTVEIVVETKAWTPPPSKYAADEIVPVRIAIAETSFKKLASGDIGARGQWGQALIRDNGARHWCAGENRRGDSE